MGDRNQLAFIDQNRDRFQGPFLEVGSRDYGSTPDIRGLFPGADYTGLDMSEGKGVDIALDLTLPFEDIDAALGGNRFHTIFCLSVMEHCDQPFVMAENLTRLLANGGMLYLSVPFAWKFHGYPSDYWRFTHAGVKKLFPQLVFEDSLDHMATSRPGETRQLDESVGLVPMSSKWHRQQGYPARVISIGLLRLLSALGILRWLTGYRYLLAPTMINMIGRKAG
jgi:hypothetical protein